MTHKIVFQEALITTEAADSKQQLIIQDPDGHLIQLVKH
jgi:hypothetical protein